MFSYGFSRDDDSSQGSNGVLLEHVGKHPPPHMKTRRKPLRR
jgi:hypothetical protein